jgi:hypothetical protein
VYPLTWVNKSVDCLLQHNKDVKCYIAFISITYLGKNNNSNFTFWSYSITKSNLLLQRSFCHTTLIFLFKHLDRVLIAIVVSYNILACMKCVMLWEINFYIFWKKHSDFMELLTLLNQDMFFNNIFLVDLSRWNIFN